MTLYAMIKRWKEDENHLPIIMRLTNGKCAPEYNIIHGETLFDNVVAVNLKTQPELKKCFAHSEPAAIVQALEYALEEKIEPGKTLLHLDEIQECPAFADVVSLFKMELPALHLLYSSSLSDYRLDLILNPRPANYIVGKSNLLYGTVAKVTTKEMCEQLNEYECDYFSNFTTAKEKALATSKSTYDLFNKLMLVFSDIQQKSDPKKAMFHCPIFEMVNGECTKVFLPTCLTSPASLNSTYQALNYKMLLKDKMVKVDARPVVEIDLAKFYSPKNPHLAHIKRLIASGSNKAKAQLRKENRVSLTYVNQQREKIEEKKRPDHYFFRRALADAVKDNKSTLVDNHQQKWRKCVIS